jgi:hypothetical protein
MGVQAGETPSSVSAFAPKKGRPDPTEGHAATTIVADDAGHGIIALLQKAADMAKSDCDRAMSLAHKLSLQVRAVEERAHDSEARASEAEERAHDSEARSKQAEERAHSSEARVKEAEERAREFEAEANYFRDRAAHAEKWLLRIQTEIDQTFFQNRNNATKANQPR